MYIPTTQLAQQSVLWTTSIDETGTSLANWTQVSGSWSVVSGAFQVDTTGGTIARLKYNTSQDAFQGSIWVMEADIRMDSAGIGSDAPAGFLYFWPGVTSGSPAVQLFKAGAGAGTKQVRTEHDATAARIDTFTPSPTWALDAYQNFKLVAFGARINVLLNDVLVASGTHGPGPSQDGSTDYGHTTAQFVGLIANNAVVNFKNISLKYLALP